MSFTHPERTIMPASLTRICPSCSKERNTPDDFRDAGFTGPGRPPVTCRECREADPALVERHARNVANRPGLRAHRARYRGRSEAAILAVQRDAYPSGLKLCPEFSGCGLRLPLDAFSRNRGQRDGIESICIACREAHAELRVQKG
jgi:hypothetical protein